MPPKKLSVSKKKPSTSLKPGGVSERQLSLSWPALTPILLPSDLDIQEVLAEQILTIPQFFTWNLCKSYVNFLQKSVSLITTPTKPKKGDAVRVNDRFQIHDAAFAARLWDETGLKAIIARENLWGGEVVGLNPK
jgi:hypothetical protein